MLALVVVVHFREAAHDIRDHPQPLRRYLQRRQRARTDRPRRKYCPHSADYALALECGQAFQHPGLAGPQLLADHPVRLRLERPVALELVEQAELEAVHVETRSETPAR